MSALTLSIVSHGHGALLNDLLRDLEQTASVAGARVIVTLNLAGESLQPSDYPRLQLSIIRNPRPLGFGANHNQAFRQCTTPWFAVLNPDLRLQLGDPFASMLDAARQSPVPGLVAPVVVDGNGHEADSMRRNLTLPSLLSRALLRRRAPVAVQRDAAPGAPFHWVAGMFMLLRSDVYRELGGFDPRYFLYCEDFDLCARSYLAGHAIRVDRRARVVHLAQRDSHRRWQHLRWHLASLLKVWTSRPFWQLVLHAPRR